MSNSSITIQIRDLVENNRFSEAIELIQKTNLENNINDQCSLLMGRLNELLEKTNNGTHFPSLGSVKIYFLEYRPEEFEDLLV